MFRKSTTVTERKRPLAKRLAFGFAGVTTAAIIGSAGIAAAHPAQQTMYLPDKATCASQWPKYQFKNRGQCESFWDQHKHDHHPGNGGGSGYGGNGGVTIIVNGNGNNIIIVIINFFH